MNATATAMSVGFVAFSRCLSLQNRQLCRKCLYGARGIAVCCLIWVYGIIMVIPSLIGAYGQFGYNRKLGKCDFLENNDGLNPHMFFYGVGFVCPLLLLVGSYFLIWRMSRKSSQYLKKLAYENKQQLDYRDHRLTVMILFVCGCYVLFVGPIAIIKLVDVKVTLPGLDLIFHVLYWLQYSLNFFIYALRNEQFRKAYKLFILFGLKKYCCSSGSERAPHTPIFLINPNLPGTRDNQSVLRPDLPAELAEREIVEQFNCDIELLGRSIRSYVEHAGSQTIIILPGRLSDSILEQLMRENQSCAKKIKKKNNKKSVRFYSEGEVLQSRNTEKNINHSCPGHF